MSLDSLDSYLDFMVENDIDDPRIYSHLADVDAERLSTWLARLKRVGGATPPQGKARKGFRGRQSALMGRVYESLVATLVDGVRCFHSWQRIASSTNEIDILIVLGPTAKHVPALRVWNTHCICECKYHSTHVQNAWVSQLNTVLQTHGAAVGMLFSRKGIAHSGNGARVRTTLQILANAATPAYIVALDWEDLAACLNGKNFLELVSERFVEARTGSRKLRLLAS